MLRDAWVSASTRAGSGVRSAFRGRSFIGAVITGFVLVILMALIAIPMLVLVGILILWALVSTGLRALLRGFGRAQQPNGVLDGRKNVRVRMPDQQQS